MIANGRVVYPLRPAWRLWAIFCLSLGLGLLGLGGWWLLGILDVPVARAFLVNPGTGKSSIIWLMVGYAGLIMGWGPCLHGLRLWKVYLVVSTKGLEYYGLKGRVQGLWHEIDRYGAVAWGGPYAAEGVLLRHRAEVGIPVELFAANWPTSPVGAVILQRAFMLTPRPAAAPLRAPVVSLPPRRRTHRIPKAPAPLTPPSVARPAITRRLRPLKLSGDAVPGEWQGAGTGQLEEHDGDTVRF